MSISWFHKNINININWFHIFKLITRFIVLSWWKYIFTVLYSQLSILLGFFLQKDNKVLLLWFCFFLINPYYDTLILFQLQVNVFYTKNLNDVSMKWGVINLNTPFNNWSCINTLIHTFRVKFMVLNATFNNISVILWWSVLLLEESGVPGENHRPVASHWQTSYRTHLAWVWFKLTMLVVLGTDCILLGL